MLLTKCAACATTLAHDHKPKCAKCKTRYCDRECQKRHWRSGHKQLCKEVEKGGGAEQHNADKKNKEAVATAVDACKKDTKGQTCYICTEALHWKTKEGLVRGCACRGTAGFAHVSCLAEQAKILVAEAKENNKDPQWHRWNDCSLCEQRYHGVVKCAFGWACWKTYVSRPEGDQHRIWAMASLGLALRAGGHIREATAVLEAALALIRRETPNDCHTILSAQNTLASLYGKQGRRDDELSLRRQCYAASKLVEGPCSLNLLINANNLGMCLHKRGDFAESMETVREPLADARRTLGDDHWMTLNFRETTADNFAGLGGDANLGKSIAIYEDLVGQSRRLLGAAHPSTQQRERCLRQFRALLAGGVPAGFAEWHARNRGA